MVMVVYDIPNDSTRLRVADACLDFGLDRIQFSVFTGNLTAAHRKDLYLKLKNILGKQIGKIVVTFIAEDDWNARKELIHLDPNAQAPAKTLKPGWEEE